jgi:hypothetical protein
MKGKGSIKKEKNKNSKFLVEDQGKKKVSQGYKVKTSLRTKSLTIIFIMVDN